MKNRKLYQLFIASVISATMMTSGISVSASDFSDDTSTVEEQSVGSAEEEAPEVEDGSEFQSDAAEASSAVRAHGTESVSCDSSWNSPLRLNIHLPKEYTISYHVFQAN